MKFLASPEEISAEFNRGITSCSSFSGAVAWASNSCGMFDELTKHADKISMLTVGLHFYQTHPHFIRTFSEHSRVRFVLNPDGVFHPKVYFFDLGCGKWECIVGSANFTGAAFNVNSEAAVLICDTDVDAGVAHSKIQRTLQSWFDTAAQVTPEFISAYENIWTRQQRRLGKLSGRYDNHDDSKKSSRSPLDIPIFAENWPEFYSVVKDDPVHSLEGRLMVLEVSRRLFQKFGSLAAMPVESRKGIAGIIETADINWLWFGSMKGAGHFKHAIIEEPERISSASDIIPATGIVSRDHFLNFVSAFRGSFENSGIATATRLLAMKRPDYFICLDSKNRANLCKEFRISQNIELEDYWDKVVSRILDSNWWNSPKPENEVESRVWAGRAAFLDVRFYEP